MKHMRGVVEQTWARLVLRAWRHVTDRHSSSRAEQVALRLLGRSARQRQQREMLQRWASSAREARTVAATDLIAHRCQAALTSALHKLGSGGGDGGGGGSGEAGEAGGEYSAAYEPLHVALGEETTAEYTPFEPARMRSRAVATPSRRYAPVDVERLAASAASTIEGLVDRLRGVADWLRRESGADEDARSEAVDYSISAPATPLAGGRTRIVVSRKSSRSTEKRTAAVTVVCGQRHAARDRYDDELRTKFVRTLYTVE